MLERINTALQLLPIGFTETSELSTPLQIARFLAPLVFAYATLRAVFALFRDRSQDVRAGFRRNHVIVCGLGAAGQALLATAPRGHIVAVDKDANSGAVRRLRDSGAIVLVGDATDRETLRRAGLDRARAVIAVCGDDAVNAEVAATLLAATKRPRPRPLDAFIHIADPRLYSFLLHRGLEAGVCRLEIFNGYNRAARSLLEEVSPASWRGGASVLVVGAGQFGRALTSLLGLEWRERRADGQDRLVVHLADLEARRVADLLKQKYSLLEEFCELVPHEADVESPSFDSLLATNPELAHLGAAYVCFDGDAKSIATALSLARQSRGRFPIAVRVSDEVGGLSALLAGVPEHDSVLRPFSVAGRAFHTDLVVAGMLGALARQIHEEYGQIGTGGPFDIPWESLDAAGRGRSIRHAEQMASQLRVVGYRFSPMIDWSDAIAQLTPADIERMSELEHDRWMEERIREGYRYGPVRDDGIATHPDLVPWRELPEKQKEINRVLIRKRPDILARAGIALTRDSPTTADAPPSAPTDESSASLERLTAG